MSENSSSENIGNENNFGYENSKSSSEGQENSENEDNHAKWMNELENAWKLSQIEAIYRWA